MARCRGVKEKGYERKKARYPGYKTTTSCFVGLVLACDETVVCGGAAPTVDE